MNQEISPEIAPGMNYFNWMLMKINIIDCLFDFLLQRHDSNLIVKDCQNQ
jgi:hypothetical protein